MKVYGSPRSTAFPGLMVFRIARGCVTRENPASCRACKPMTPAQEQPLLDAGAGEVEGGIAQGIGRGFERGRRLDASGAVGESHLPELPHPAFAEIP